MIYLLHWIVIFFCSSVNHFSLKPLQFGKCYWNLLVPNLLHYYKKRSSSFYIYCITYMTFYPLVLWSYSEPLSNNRKNRHFSVQNNPCYFCYLLAEKKKHLDLWLTLPLAKLNWWSPLLTMGILKWVFISLFCISDNFHFAYFFNYVIPLF